VTDDFLDSKRDRRHIRRSAFRSQITESAPRTNRGVTKPRARTKTRRPGKKLATTLAALADALPEVAEAAPRGVAADEGRIEGLETVRHKSLRSRPGALKRKEKLVRGEVARFGKSLGQLTAMRKGEAEMGSHPAQVDAAADEGAEAVAEDQARPGAAEAPKTSTANRWAALRGFISATMEQNPAFLPKR